MLYTNASDRNAVSYLDMDTTTTLTQYRNDEFVESEIVLTVLQGVPMNGTVLVCMSEDLASEYEVVHVNTSGKFPSMF